MAKRGVADPRRAPAPEPVLFSLTTLLREKRRQELGTLSDIVARMKQSNDELEKSMRARGWLPPKPPGE